MRNDTMQNCAFGQAGFHGFIEMVWAAFYSTLTKEIFTEVPPLLPKNIEIQTQAFARRFMNVVGAACGVYADTMKEEICGNCEHPHIQFHSEAYVQSIVTCICDEVYACIRADPPFIQQQECCKWEVVQHPNTLILRVLSFTT